ncbi:hypothetical protein LCGC14_0405960 [marine sediment metagenome]|uniref:Uncharacterized protein n=1 Tax=marine sediment metagenome TaxID=412755 RepID=A0A0F9TDD4_9ZZZZ
MTKSILADLLEGGTSCSLPQHKWVSWWMLFHKRQYVIDKIKKPLMKAIVTLAMRYPEATKDHTLLPKTHILIDIQNKFFEYENNKGRDALFRAMWRMFIIEYEHDGYYRDRIDWVIEEIVKSGWGIRPIRFPVKCWKEKC